MAANLGVPCCAAMQSLYSGVGGWLTWVGARADGELIAVGDDAGRLRIWSPGEGRVVARHELGSRITRAEWTTDGERLIAIAQDSEQLHVLSGGGSGNDPASACATIATRHGSVASLAVHPSRPWAATTGTDGHVRVWDLSREAGAEPVLDVTEPSAGTCVAMSDKHLAAGFRSGQFVAWDLETGKEIAGGGHFTNYVSAMAFSADAQSLVIGGGAGGLVEIHPETWRTGETWRSTPPRPIATNSIAFGPKGAFLCAHSDDTASFFQSKRSFPRSLGTAFHLDGKPWQQEYIVSSACFVAATQIMITSHFTGRLRIWKKDGMLIKKLAEIGFDENDTPRFYDAPVTDSAIWWSESSGRTKQKRRKAAPKT